MFKHIAASFQFICVMKQICSSGIRLHKWFFLSIIFDLLFSNSTIWRPWSISPLIFAVCCVGLPIWTCDSSLLYVFNWNRLLAYLLCIVFIHYEVNVHQLAQYIILYDLAKMLFRARSKKKNGILQLYIHWIVLQQHVYTFQKIRGIK